MKKFYLLFVAAALAACSLEPIANEGLDSLDAAVTGKNKTNDQEAGDSFDIPDLICAGEEATFTFNFNDKPGNFNLKVQLFGDDPATEEEVVEWYNIFNKQIAGGGPEYFDYTFEEAGVYAIRYFIGGGPTEISVMVENCGCEESFTYVDNGDKTYTFTYIPEEDMPEAELVFTFAQGTSVDGLDSWTNNGKAQTWHLTDDLIACQTYSWTVTLDANCPGKSGENNVWTDFKVNDDSKKDDSEDKFIQVCSN